nr:variant surface glycoprotein 1125.258 [Trypanosoma brucei]
MLIIISLAGAALANNEAFKEAAVVKLCKLSANQKKVSLKVNADAQLSKTMLQGLAAFKTKLQVLATRQTQHPLAGSVLELATSKLYEQILISLEARIEKGTKATATASYAAGRIDEFVGLIALKTSGNRATNTCIEPTSGNDMADEQLADCQSSVLLKTAEAAQADTHVAAVAASDIPDDAATKGQSKSCLLTQDNGQQLISGQAVSPAIKFIDGFYAHTPTATWATARIKPIGDSPALSNAKTAATNLRSEPELPSIPIPTDEASLIQFLESPTAKNKIAEAIKELKELSTLPQNSQLTTELNTIFGEPTSNKSRPFTHELNALKFDVKTKGAQSKVAFFSLEEKQILQIIEKVVTDLRDQASKAEDAKCTVEAKEDKQKECEAIEQDTVCNAKKYCSYVKESDGTTKCKYNETKAKEKGVSVTQTQTTGGAAGEGVKCSDHKDQATCEKANEGNTTKVCGWEGENTNGSDKSGYKYRDFSFSINKKLALMVAAFMVW